MEKYPFRVSLAISEEMNEQLNKIREETLIPTSIFLRKLVVEELKKWEFD